MGSKISVPGINIRSPWAELIACGEKTIETRSYPLPAKYIGREMAIIATYGGKRPAQIVALVTFEGCYEYRSRAQWIRDSNKHRVEPTSEVYQFTSQVPKFAWVIGEVKAVTCQPAPKQRGIKFCLECPVEL